MKTNKQQQQNPRKGISESRGNADDGNRPQAVEISSGGLKTAFINMLKNLRANMNMGSKKMDTSKYKPHTHTHTHTKKQMEILELQRQ